MARGDVHIIGHWGGTLCGGGGGSPTSNRQCQECMWAEGQMTESRHNPSAPPPEMARPRATSPIAPRPPVETMGGAPDVSIVFGTYNRRPLLERAVESARRAADGITYELVICDGGSTDGSCEWLLEQPDVVLIAERELRGAVKAFNNAFSVSRGKHVANFNDDARYDNDGSLTRAKQYLDDHPEVGQVCFEFATPSEAFHINQVYRASWPTHYANYGLTRREAALDAAEITNGFWNPIYDTYAGDCELSAWLHRLGWLVQPLVGERVVDMAANDALRAKNGKRSSDEARLFYLRWPPESFRPDGPDPFVLPEEKARFARVKQARLVANEKKIASPSDRDLASHYAQACVEGGWATSIKWPEPQEERRLASVARRLHALDPRGEFPAQRPITRERVLHVALVTETDPQAGLVRALKKLGSDGYAEVNWLNAMNTGGADAVRKTILEVAYRLRPTVVFMQLQTPGVVDATTVIHLREMLRDARLVVATWCGDVASSNSPWTVDWQKSLGRACDITLHSSLTHVRALRAAGIHNAAYLQIGYDQEQYKPQKDVTRASFSARPYDVVFLGTRYYADGYTSSLRRHDGDVRDAVVTALDRAIGGRFGLFGAGYDPPRMLIPLSQAHDMYWRSMIGLNTSLMNYAECYSSDRLHRILGCGSVALVARFPGMDVWGLRDGENCVIWDTPDQAVEQVNLLTTGARDGDGDRAKSRCYAIAQAGAKLALEHHTWDVRMRELVPYLDTVRGG